MSSLNVIPSASAADLVAGCKIGKSKVTAKQAASIVGQLEEQGIVLATDRSDSAVGV